MPSASPDPFREYDEMRRKDARAAILREIGKRQNYSGNLTLDTLNSVHRYFTGEFYFPPSAYRTPLSPSHREVRFAIVVHLANRDYEPFHSLLKGGEDYNGTRAFRREELVGLLKAIKDHPNKHPMHSKSTA